MNVVVNFFISGYFSFISTLLAYINTLKDEKKIASDEKLTTACTPETLGRCLTYGERFNTCTSSKSLTMLKIKESVLSLHIRFVRLK